MTSCSLCGREAGSKICAGTPVCGGPVCRWCYETKVMPEVRRNERKGPSTADSPKGAWAFRSREGITVGSDPWWIAHELARALHPSDGAEAWCAMAEEAVSQEPAKGKAWNVMGKTVEWLPPAFLHAPASTLAPVERA